MMENPAFWVSVSFGIFILLVIKPLYRFITQGLDKRAADIATELNEAKALRAEAETLLAAYQKKHRESMRDAEEILSHAKDEAARLIDATKAELSRQLEARQKSAEEKIARAEVDAVRDVREHVIQLAMQTAKQKISAGLDAQTQESLTAQAIGEIGRKLH